MRIHDLRYSFASCAGARREPDQEPLGRTQVQTTARYARDSIQTAAARIAEIIGGNFSGDYAVNSRS